MKTLSGPLKKASLLCVDADLSQTHRPFIRSGAKVPYSGKPYKLSKGRAILHALISSTEPY